MFDILSISIFQICRGSSVVERKPEELGVVGSIPTLGTKLRSRGSYVWQASFLTELYFV